MDLKEAVEIDTNVDNSVLSSFESGDLDQKSAKRARMTTNGMYNDIEEMMFGFGDQWPPDENCVRLAESIVTNYIEDLTMRAAQIATMRGKMDKECFMFVVRKDRRKFSRIHTLLKANEELKSVQKMEMKDPEQETGTVS
jgi:transcription initiation factor TFIID subunit 13